MAEKNADCVFCKIGEQKEQILAENERLLLIADIRPHAPHHYLVITKVHLGKPTELKTEHAPLIREMEVFGKERLAERLNGEVLDDARLRCGFHWPPLIGVAHLHLHLLYPAEQIYFFYRQIIFRPGPFFRSPGVVAAALEATTTTALPEQSGVTNRTGSSNI